jgi:hypothetical protein
MILTEDAKRLVFINRDAHRFVPRCGRQLAGLNVRDQTAAASADPRVAIRDLGFSDPNSAHHCASKSHSSPKIVQTKLAAGKSPRKILPPGRMLVS